MAKKIRRMRTFARTAAKPMEKKLVENAKKLKQNPYQILPEYNDNYSQKIFEKIKKTLQKIDRFKDDTKKLEKLSNKRDLSGALAGALLIAHSEKAPYLAVAKFPTGETTYAQRGRADKEKQIAVQHFDNPVLRLLGIKDIAQKRRLHLYSWDNGYLSTGLEPDPPEEFVSFLIKKTGFKKTDKIAHCGDIKPDIIKNKKPHKNSYLRINWQSADTIFAICEDCAKSKKNTMFNLTKYILQPNLGEDFKIDVVGQVVKQKETQHETINLDEYLSGKLTDYQFIQKNMKHREQTLKDSGEKMFILDGTSYGTNSEEFIKALKPNKYEKQGLEIILEQVDEPVVMDDVTPNKVLEKYWKKHGLSTLESIIDDQDMAKKFYQLDDTPSDILQLVYNYDERQQILSKLPTYKNLPTLARFVDNIARTYKTFGEKKVLSELKKRPNDPKGKSIAYAFLLLFDKAKDSKWQYSPVEIEYGEFLKEYVKKLLNADPKNYHKILQELLVASGSSENIDNNKI